jgi:hypothetical protein
MDFAFFVLANHVQRVKLEIVVFIKPSAFEPREEHQDLTVRVRTLEQEVADLKKRLAA